MGRRTPYYDRHVAAGGRMVEFAGFDMPVVYSSIGEEHRRVRSAVGLFDVSHMGEVDVIGPKAEAALMWLLSNNVAEVGIGQAQYNVMCNEAGGVVDDLVVYRRGPEQFLVCINAANRDKDFQWMVKHNPYPEGAVFTQRSDAWAQVAVQGPRAAELCQSLTDLDLSLLENYRFAEGRFADIDGCIVARTGYTGEDGFEVFAPTVGAHGLWGRLMAEGAGAEILPIGLGARDTLRLEVRYCLYGHELDDRTSPLQARLGWITKLQKPGGFLGADAILAKKNAGGGPALAGLLLDGKRIAREGMAVLSDGEPVGRVTSGTRAPSVDRSIALAYVERPHGRPGTRLTVDVRGRSADAVVVDGPFYRRVS